MVKRLVAPLLVAALLGGASPAFADPEPSAFGPPGEVPPAKSATTYILAGVGFAGLLLSGVSLGLQASAASDHDAFPTKNGFKDCLTPSQCDDLDSTRKREQLWGTMTVASFAVGVTSLLSVVAVRLFWPHTPAAAPVTKASIGPLVAQGGGGLQLGSSF